MADGGDKLSVHGSCIAVDGTGVLLRGPSGAGKSDLALRMIDAGARLVADDQVEIRRDGDRLVAAPPDALAGLLEVRGLGIVTVEKGALALQAPLGLIVDIVGADGAIDRLPGDDRDHILGLAVPRIYLSAFEITAPVKVRLAVGAGPGSIMASEKIRTD